MEYRFSFNVRMLVLLVVALLLALGLSFGLGWVLYRVVIVRVGGIGVGRKRVAEGC